MLGSASPVERHALAVLDEAITAEVDLAAYSCLLNQVGIYLGTVARYQDALMVYRRSLVLAEGVWGPEHAEVAVCANNLGHTLRILGDNRAALQYTERALRIDEAVYGRDHPNVATDANNLGQIHQALGDLPAARAYLERALRICTATLGPDHPTPARRPQPRPPRPTTK
ncbi:MAG: tetratricopeptide repeat protein [Acidobacteria bacterium]|nr:tetratricopeptide repeat protein [Acidobacteriota bacterium]